MAGPEGRTEPPGGGTPARAQLVVPRAGSRGPLLGAALVLVLLGVAVLKPWGDPGRAGGADELGLRSPGTAAASASSGPDATATPSPTPIAYDAPGGQCFPGTDWRVFTVETNAGRRQRTWVSVEPTRASSALDASIPFVTIVADQLLGLGFCVGSAAGGEGQPIRARAWALAADGRAVPIGLAPLAEHMPRSPDLGAVYRPPAAPPRAAEAGWPPGRYVFAIRRGREASPAWWFGVRAAHAPANVVAP